MGVMPDDDMDVTEPLSFLAIRWIRHIQFPGQPSAWACLQHSMACAQSPCFSRIAAISS